LGTIEVMNPFMTLPCGVNVAAVQTQCCYESEVREIHLWWTLNYFRII